MDFLFAVNFAQIIKTYCNILAGHLYSKIYQWIILQNLECSGLCFSFLDVNSFWHSKTIERSNRISCFYYKILVHRLTSYLLEPFRFLNNKIYEFSLSNFATDSKENDKFLNESKSSGFTKLIISLNEYFCGLILFIMVKCIEITKYDIH